MARGSQEWRKQNQSSLVLVPYREQCGRLLVAERDIMADVVLYSDQSSTAGETYPDDELFKIQKV